LFELNVVPLYSSMYKMRYVINRRPQK